MDREMTDDKIVEELNEVLQIDVDAVGAYDSAIDAIDEFAIKQQLIQFRGDHERHIVDLRAIIQRCGGKPVEKPDLKGLMQKGMTVVRGAIGTEQALKAMLSNEKVTNSVYQKHVQKAFPPDILDVLRRNYADEQRHFAWIEMCLRDRLWEQAPVHP